MNYRVYTNKNIDARTGWIFATYFKTKREAVAFAATLEGMNGVTEIHLERKAVTTWNPCR